MFPYKIISFGAEENQPCFQFTPCSSLCAPRVQPDHVINNEEVVWPRPSLQPAGAHEVYYFILIRQKMEVEN